MKPIREGSIPSFLDHFGLTYAGSSNVWYGGGHPFSHSRFVEVRSTVSASRLDVNASQMMKIISITAVSEMKEPIDEIVFHVV